MVKAIINNQMVLDFIYDLHSSVTFSPDILVNMLIKHFDFSNVGFMTYTGENGLAKGSMNFEVFCNRETYAKNFSEVAINYNELPTENERQYMRYYNMKYFREDFMDPLNLPQEYRGRTVLRSSDLPEELYKNSEYYRYLTSLGLYYFMSVYLYRGITCVARIGLLRSKYEGEFTDAEVELMSVINRYITQKLPISMEYQRMECESNLLNASLENLSCGVVILDQQFSIIYSNASAFQLAEEIIAAKNDFSDKTHIKGNSSLNTIVTSLVNNYLGNSHPEQLEYSTNDVKYSCELVSFGMSDKSNEMKMYKFMYITKNSRVGDKSHSQFVNKYSLTNREAEILQLIFKGYNNSRISEELIISINTVKSHVSNIFRKTECVDRTSLVCKFREEFGTNTAS